MKNNIIQKSISHILICAIFITCLYGCYSNEFITADEYKVDPDYEIVEIITKDSVMYVFKIEGHKQIPHFDGESIIGVANNKSVKIPLQDVDTMIVSEMNVPLTLLATIGIAGGALLILAIIALNDFELNLFGD